MLLPEPLVPTTAQLVPAGTVRETSCRQALAALAMQSCSLLTFPAGAHHCRADLAGTMRDMSSAHRR